MVCKSNNTGHPWTHIGGLDVAPGGRQPSTLPEPSCNLGGDAGFNLCPPTVLPFH